MCDSTSDLFWISRHFVFPSRTPNKGDMAWWSIASPSVTSDRDKDSSETHLSSPVTGTKWCVITWQLQKFWNASCFFWKSKQGYSFRLYYYDLLHKRDNLISFSILPNSIISLNSYHSLIFTYQNNLHMSRDNKSTCQNLKSVSHILQQIVGSTVACHIESDVLNKNFK